MAKTLLLISFSFRNNFSTSSQGACLVKNFLGSKIAFFGYQPFDHGQKLFELFGEITFLINFLYPKSQFIKSSLDELFVRVLYCSISNHHIATFFSTKLHSMTFKDPTSSATHSFILFVLPSLSSHASPPLSQQLGEGGHP